MVAIAQTVDDLVSRLEKDLGVNGAGLTVLFCATLGVLVLLLLAADRYSKKRALQVAHAGQYAAPDPVARRFHLHRAGSPGASTELADPITVGPARDASNPRYRPEIALPPVVDPAFPSLAELRKTVAANGGVLNDFGSPSSSESLVDFSVSRGLPGHPSLYGLTEPTSMLAPKEPALVGGLGDGLGDGPVGGAIGLPTGSAGGSPTAGPLVEQLGSLSSSLNLPVVISAASVPPAEVSVLGNTQPDPPPDLGSGAAPLAGWYHDPEGKPGDLRFWDGKSWTERRPG
jgi:hypothetical protein